MIWKEDYLEEGYLSIKKLPLNTANIFLNQQRDFLGGLDMNLFYNLDTKSFSSSIDSNNLSINENQIKLEKGFIKYNDSIFNIDFSLLINNSKFLLILKA